MYAKEKKMLAINTDVNTHSLISQNPLKITVVSEFLPHLKTLECLLTKMCSQHSSNAKVIDLYHNYIKNQ